MEIQPDEQPEQTDNSVFSINTWFNNLPVRIIGSPEEPFFYAKDLAAILGIKHVGTSIKNFSQIDIVTPEMRIKYNLITYRKYKKDVRRDDSVVLLTEYGAYRLIFSSRSVIAQDFRAHIYETVHNIRLKETAKLIVIEPEKLQAITAELSDLKSIVEKYQKYNPAIYVFFTVVNGNPYDCMLPEDRDPDIKKYKSCKKLYKFTTKPTAADYTNYRLYAEIYGTNGHIMDTLSEYSLELKSKSLKYCRYIPDCDFDDYDFCDFSDCDFVYM